VTSLIVGAGLDARLGLSLDELRQVGVEAARLGFESLWTPAGGVPDAFHVCARWSEATRGMTPAGLRTGISVIPTARMWTVPALAVQAATVGQISGGNFVLGLGTGGYGSAFWRGAGLPDRPLAVMRDYVSVLRRLLAGETVTHDGPAVRLEKYGLRLSTPPVPVYLGALGPGMLRLAGECADGVLLNWATPQAIAWSAERVAEGAARAGRAPSQVPITMYIRVCVDQDEQTARESFAREVLGYAMARPGVDPTLGYRGHFGRMGFEEVLRDLEARRDKGVPIDELATVVPEELLQTIGYYGPSEGAAPAYRRLSEGLDESVVRVITARPGIEPVVEALQALAPSKVLAS
jgi:alkanesulfonate monooxygenase SsuD/methylene tetrahydromethanopterin reductase-like flavin-dependent oxidoreductase (luciferase family)